MLRSLRARLLLGLLPALTLLLAGGCGWLYWYQREMLLNDFDRQLGRTAFEELRRLRRSAEDGRVQPGDLPGQSGEHAVEVVLQLRVHAPL